MNHRVFRQLALLAGLLALIQVVVPDPPLPAILVPVPPDSVTDITVRWNQVEARYHRDRDGFMLKGPPDALARFERNRPPDRSDPSFEGMLGPLAGTALGSAILDRRARELLDSITRAKLVVLPTPGDAAAAGLARPVAEIVLEPGLHRLEVGSETPGGNARYVRVAGAGRTGLLPARVVARIRELAEVDLETRGN